MTTLSTLSAYTAVTATSLSTKTPTTNCVKSWSKDTAEDWKMISECLNDPELLEKVLQQC